MTWYCRIATRIGGEQLWVQCGSQARFSFQTIAAMSLILLALGTPIRWKGSCFLLVDGFSFTLCIMFSVTGVNKWKWQLCSRTAETEVYCEHRPIFKAVMKYFFLTLSLIYSIVSHSAISHTFSPLWLVYNILWLGASLFMVQMIY